MASPVFLNRIETAVPETECHSLFVNLLPHIVPPSECPKVQKMIGHLGIEKRHTVLKVPFDLGDDLPDAFYRPGRFPDTEKRMQAYQDLALPLASRALEPLFRRLPARDVTHVIVTTCTGFYAPGLDADIVRAFSLATSVERTIIGFMGCYAGVSGLKSAYHIIRSQTRAKVLLLSLELCSLHWREDPTPDQLVSFLLFGDGCAAALLSSEPEGISLDGFYAEQRSEDRELMKWTIGNDGFYMTLDARIPDSLENILKARRDGVLGGCTPHEIDLWAVHPGGRAILDRVEKVYELGADDLNVSRKILRDYGNMSSATILFVLKEFLKNGRTGRGCGMAFGPGLSLESFTFSRT